jgi:transglutaminase-like putative cysteine protease
MKAASSSRWDWSSAALLIAAVFTAAIRLDSTKWTPDLGYVESFAVFGTLLGLGLGLSQFKPITIRLMVLLYSVFTLPIYLSRIISSEETAIGQLSSLAGRFWASIQLILDGKAVEDYIFFVVLMAVLFWGIGIFSGYKLVRSRSIFSVLLPSTIPMLVIQYYDGYKPERIWGLAFYFFLALLLAGRINLLNSHDRWEDQQVVAGSDPEFDLSKNIISAAAVIIMVAWLLPAPGAVIPAAAKTWRNLNEPFENFRKRMDDILAALNSGRINTTVNELYGSSMGLGRAAGTGEKILFSVYAPEKSIPRFYWRMRAYDYYGDGGWQILNSQNVLFDPAEGDFVNTGIDPGPISEFTFTWQTSQAILLATPSLPIWVSRQGSVQIFEGPNEETDLLSWNVSPTLRSGDRYQVRARQDFPTQKQLRDSGNNYPAWITERYLQVPEINADQFKNLALEITQDLPTNFDRAEAITQYLRKNITYNETIPAPPPNVDPLNWFLFTWKSGFCNYYASAEVLLLRSLGIPARMVVGFAEGELETESENVYDIRGLDAHAWPEVYFPGVGWVPFEPTVSQDPIVRPSGDLGPRGPSNNPLGGPFADGIQNNPRFDQENDEFSNRDTAPVPTVLGLTSSQWLWVVISSFIIVLGGGLAWGWRHRSLPDITIFVNKTPRAIKALYSRYNLKTPAWVDDWIRWSEVSSVERAFHAVNQSLAWLKTPQPNYATPVERAKLLKGLLSEASGEIDLLSTALEETLFTNHVVDTSKAFRASWRLRYFAIRKIVRQWLYGE